MSLRRWIPAAAILVTSAWSKTAFCSYPRGLARSRASPNCWAFKLVCFSRMALRSRPWLIKIFWVITVGRKRFRVCSVQPYG